jgi:hypothetical protein
MTTPSPDPVRLLSRTADRLEELHRRLPDADSTSDLLTTEDIAACIGQLKSLITDMSSEAIALVPDAFLPDPGSFSEREQAMVLSAAACVAGMGLALGRLMAGLPRPPVGPDGLDDLRGVCGDLAVAAARIREDVHRFRDGTGDGDAASAASNPPQQAGPPRQQYAPGSAGFIHPNVR